MLKLLLERTSKTLRANEQFEVEVNDLAEAVEVKAQHMGYWGGSDYQYAETGRITFPDGKEYYIGMNGRVWDGKYWESKNGKCFNDEVEEVLV